MNPTLRRCWPCAALLSLVGCGESPAPVAADVPPVTVDGGGPEDVTDAGSAPDVTGVGRVVINEIRAVGDDWVELKNVGGARVDLGGLVLADTDTAVDGGGPRVSDGLRFPAGTSLAPGEYLLVIADLRDAGVGPQMTCLPGAGPMTCYQIGFGISASRGERIYLLDALGAVVTAADYPANAVVEGRTWARLPDGTGEFAAAAPTPGSANRAP